MLKIKTDELFKKWQCETIELKEGNITYKSYASYDNKEKVLELNLAYRGTGKVIVGDNQEEWDPIE